MLSFIVRFFYRRALNKRITAIINPPVKVSNIAHFNDARWAGHR